MTKQLLILGAGGNGRVLADTAEDAGWDIAGFLDDDGSGLQRWAVLGSLMDLAIVCTECTSAIVSIADAALRQELSEQVLAGGKSLAIVRSHAAHISSSVTIGPGTMVYAGCIVQYGTVIGTGCILNTGSSVDHDCVLGDFVHIAPGARVGGNVEVGDRSWVGIGANVRNGVSICADVVIGAGAAVVSNITHPGTYIGVPAKAVE